MFPPAPEAKSEAQLASGVILDSAVDEEANNHTLTCMLEDPTGRLHQSLPTPNMIFVCPIGISEGQ